MPAFAYASFVVNGAAQTSDVALVTASAEKKWLNGWSAAATFEREFSRVSTSYAGKSVVRYTWRAIASTSRSITDRGFDSAS